MVLVKVVDLSGKGMSVLRKYREDPTPSEPARMKADRASEVLSREDIEKILTDRYVHTVGDVWFFT